MCFKSISMLYNCDYYIDPLFQQLDKRHFCSFEISPIENFDDIYSGLLTLSITVRS